MFRHTLDEHWPNLPINAAGFAVRLEATMTKKDYLETTVFAAVLLLGLPAAILMSLMAAG